MKTNKDGYRQCPFCERFSLHSTFRDITTCGDCWTVCGECAEKFDDNAKKKVDNSVKPVKVDA